MIRKNAPFLVGLISLLNNRGKDVIYPCVEDLVKNGLSLDRFSSGDCLPSRQDVTQYLAAWCRHVGITEALCLGWLIEYCVVMLSPISKTSMSGIRHSTKSNVKYIYQADIPFRCDRDSNPFRAQCSDNCPEYAGRQESLPERGKEILNRGLDVERPKGVTEIPPLSVKESYRDQFEKALLLIRSEIGKGTKRKTIIELLNEGGFKTRTGRTWTNSTFGVELRRNNDLLDDSRDGKG